MYKCCSVHTFPCIFFAESSYVIIEHPQSLTGFHNTPITDCLNFSVCQLNEGKLSVYCCALNHMPYLNKLMGAVQNLFLMFIYIVQDESYSFSYKLDTTCEKQTKSPGVKLNY